MRCVSLLVMFYFFQKQLLQLVIVMLKFSVQKLQMINLAWHIPYSRHHCLVSQ